MGGRQKRNRGALLGSRFAVLGLWFVVCELSLEGSGRWSRGEGD